MVILRTRNKITDFLMILAWASPFNVHSGYAKQVILLKVSGSQTDGQTLVTTKDIRQNFG